MNRLRSLAVGTTIETALRRPYDNFGIIRLILSLLVVISHTKSIGSTGLASSEIGYSSTGFTLGEHSVNGFFAVSGFLIAMSWDRRPQALVFLASRFLRLAPGLVGAVVITVFLIGAASTTLSPGAYLSHRETWTFIAETIFRLKSTGTLPGVFAHNPLPIVLGTVWSLKYEIGCYIGLFALGVTGLLMRPRVILCVALFFILGVELIDLLSLNLSPAQVTAFRLRSIFATGAALYVWRAHVRLSLVAAVAAIVIALLCRETPVYHATLFVAETYAILTLAMVRGLSSPRLMIGFDVSYGVYLYGMPVQQALTAVYRPENPYLLLPAAIALTLLLASFSWFFIENPALTLKKRVTARLAAARLSSNARIEGELGRRRA